MNNFILFVCGLVVTLVSAMGILVYMVSLGYEEKKTRKPEPDIDLGAAEPTKVFSAKNPKTADSFVGIPSVS